jgi:hypothetical protein
MANRVDVLIEKFVRIGAGVLLILLGKEFVEAGLSKYAPQGAAHTTHYGALALGLAILAAAATLIRPYWWREWSRRRHS